MYTHWNSNFLGSKLDALWIILAMRVEPWDASIERKRKAVEWAIENDDLWLFLSSLTLQSLCFENDKWMDMIKSDHSVLHGQIFWCFT